MPTDAEIRYRAIVENSLDGVLHTTSDGRIVEMNRAMLDMLGYEEADLDRLRLTREDVVDSSDPRFADLLVERARSGRVRGELDFRRKDGTTFPVEITSSRYLAANGDERSIVIVRDMTERVRSERALKESEERFGKAFLASPAPIALVRLRDGRFIDVNPAFTDTFGFEEKEVVGRTVGELGLADDREQARRILHALQEHGSSHETEVAYRTKEGRAGFGILTYERVELSGEPCVVVLMHDVTARRRVDEELRIARARLERAEASAMVMTIHVGLDGRMLKVPRRLGELLGYDEAELLGRRYQDFTHPDDLGREKALMPRLLAGEISSFEFEKRYVRRDGGILWVSLNVSLVRDESNEPLYFLTYLRDVSEDRRIRKEVRKRARQQEVVAGLAERITADEDLQELLDLAARTVADAVQAPFVKILELSESGRELLLRSGIGWRGVVPGETRFLTGEHSVAGIALATDAPIVFPDLTAEPRFRAIRFLRDHDVRSGVSVVVRGNDGPYGVIGAFSDRREAFDEQDAHVLKSVAGLVIGAVRQRRLLDALAHRALHDELTGLPNRAAFESRLETELARARRAGERVAVMFMDLDRFKDVNDTLGHHAGDELLRLIPERVAHALRGGDVLARLAGDEFVLMLADSGGGRDLAEVASRILRTFDDPFTLAGREVVVHATLGVCRFPDDGETVADLLRHADTAMYQGKIAGRNTFEFYGPELEAGASARLAMESDLRKALHRDEFELVFGPQIDFATRSVVAVEALLRWRHPTRGLLTPASFMSVAEETGLVVPIGEWVLREALRCFAALKAAGPTLARVGVNVAAAQLRQPGFPATVERLARAAGLQPGEVELEVSESIVAADAEGIADALDALRGVGVGVALDDFGTGYASLAHLRRLRIDRIKIDGTFTSGLDGELGDEARSFLEAMVGLARGLRVEALAEGVESEAQVAALMNLGLRGGQGLVFGPPSAADELARTLRSSSEPRSA